MIFEIFIIITYRKYGMNKLFLLCIFIILIFILYFSIFRKNSVEPFDDTPTPTQLSTNIPTLLQSNVNNVVLYSNANSDKLNQKDYVSFDAAVPVIITTTPPPIVSYDCQYNWTNWTNCDVYTGNSTRSVSTIPPVNDGEACTPPATNDIQRSCLSALQYKTLLQGWEVIYNPTSLANIGNIIVDVDNQSSNKYGMMNSIVMKKLNRPANLIESFDVGTTMTLDPNQNISYVVIGMDNTVGDFVSISNPSVTLQTTIKLDQGNYIMYFYVQNRKYDTTNMGITTSVNVNDYTNETYHFQESGKWISQMVSFYIDENDAGQDTIIQLVFTLENKRTGYNNMVALGGIQFKYCGMNPCDNDCEFSWSDWGQCNISNGISTRHPNIVLKSLNGGIPCPTNEPKNCDIDCSYIWSSWSNCDVLKGTQFRDPTIIYPNQKNGMSCPTREVSSCTIDCSYTWSDWTACDNTGTQTRVSTTIYPPLNGGATCPTTESRDCDFDCCFNWTDWGVCDVNTGNQTRNANIKYPSVHGGRKCPPDSTQPDTRACAVDCSYTWSFSDCDYYSGTIWKNPIVTYHDKNNGATCPGSKSMDCPVDCCYNWTNWSYCDVTKKMTTRNVSLINPKKGGVMCTPAPAQWLSQPCLDNLNFSQGNLNEWNVSYNWDISNTKIQPIINVISSQNNFGFTFPSNYVQLQFKGFQSYSGTTPIVTLETVANLDYGYYSIDYFIQTRPNYTPKTVSIQAAVVMTGNNGAINTVTNNEFSFSKKQIPDETVISPQNIIFFVSSDCATNPVKIQFIFKVTDPTTTTDCTVGLGNTTIRSCGKDKPCDVNCQVGWYKWSDCNKTGNYAGYTTRNSFVFIDQKNNGKPCPNTPDLNACKVDCDFTYPDWSTIPCDKSSGRKSRTAKINIPAQNVSNLGAIPCPGELDPRNVQNCPVNCEFSWGPWGSCDRNSGKHSRSPNISVQAQHTELGAVPCPGNSDPGRTESCDIDCTAQYAYYSCVNGLKQYTVGNYLGPVNKGAQCNISGTTVTGNGVVQTNEVCDAPGVPSWGTKFQYMCPNGGYVTNISGNCFWKKPMTALAIKCSNGGAIRISDQGVNTNYVWNSADFNTSKYDYLNPDYTGGMTNVDFYYGEYYGWANGIQKIQVNDTNSYFVGDLGWSGNTAKYNRTCPYGKKITGVYGTAANTVKALDFICT